MKALMILAEAAGQQQAPEASHFLNWVLSFALLVGIGVALRMLTKKELGGAKDPVNVRMDEHYVSRREYDTGINRIEKDHIKLSGELMAIARGADEREKRFEDLLNHRDERVSEQIESIAKATRDRIDEEAKWSSNARDKIHQRVTDAEKEIARVSERAGVCPKLIGCERDVH